MRKHTFAILVGLLLCSAFDISAQRRSAPAKPFESLKAADEFLQQAEKDGTFSGAVFIEVDGEVVLHKAYGLASKEKNLKNNTQTKFNIGSINKLMTKIAIAQLIQKGKISMEDKVTKYVPELSMDMADQIKIHHLLTMSSGMGFYNDAPEYVSNWRKMKNMEDYLSVIKDLPLSFEPGTSRQYSNSGYELLGIVVQRVSGENYYDYIQKHVYDVAGMKNSGSFESDKHTPNLASGYTNYLEGESMMPGSRPSGEGFKINNHDRHSVKGTAAGGGYSTTRDLAALIKALSENKLLDKKHTDLIFNNFRIQAERAPSIGIGGGSTGINAYVLANFFNGYKVIVLANYDPPTASNAARRIEATILKEKG